MSTTFSALKTLLWGSDGTGGILQDSAFYSEADSRINEAVEAIAAGIRMPDGMITPPLPELFDTDTVTTSTDYPYVSLPADYQRNLFMVADSNGDRVLPPRGGDYYSFSLFMRQVGVKDLSESGSIDLVCVKGKKLYYQGIPSAAVTLTLHFYRAPEDMSENTDVPDGIPSHLQTKLIKHYVLKEVFGEGIEDGEDSEKAGYKYHTARFYEAATELIDYVGIDAEPEYYGTNEVEYEW